MKRKKDCISIVIPVYNAEKYLDECISSIIKQTYDNLDIILVDDGSKDSSPKICDEYAKKDKRIKVIHKKNAGVSEARNTGIKEAIGDLICFVDSDDYLQKDAIEIMYKQMVEKNTKLVICANIEVYDSEIRDNNFNDNELGLFKIEDFIKEALRNCNSYLLNNPWNKLFNLNIIKKYNLKFNSEFNLGEDFMFNLDYLSYIENVLVINDKLYNYRILDSGLARKERPIKYYWDNKKVLIDYLIESLKKFKMFEDNKRYVNHFIINDLKYLFTVISNLDNYTEEVKIEEIRRMCEVVLKDYKINFFSTNVMKDNNCILLMKLKFYKKILQINKRG